MKQKIRRLLCNDKEVDDVWLFVQRGVSYQRLDGDDDEAQIGSVLSNDDVMYLVEDRFFYKMHPVYYNGEEISQVGWTITASGGYYYSETIITLKLRIQDGSMALAMTQKPKLELKWHKQSATLKKSIAELEILGLVLNSNFLT